MAQEEDPLILSQRETLSLDPSRGAVVRGGGVNSVNIAPLPSITAPQAPAMTSHCCSYPEATVALNLPDLLSAQGKINAEEEATAASWLWRVMSNTSHLPAGDPPNFRNYKCPPNFDSLCLKKQLYLPR